MITAQMRSDTEEIKNRLEMFEMKLMFQLEFFQRLFSGHISTHVSNMIEDCLNWIQGELQIMCIAQRSSTENYKLALGTVHGTILVSVVSSCLEGMITEQLAKVNSKI